MRINKKATPKADVVDIRRARKKNRAEKATGDIKRNAGTEERGHSKTGE